MAAGSLGEECGLGSELYVRTRLALFLFSTQMDQKCSVLQQLAMLRLRIPAVDLQETPEEILKLRCRGDNKLKEAQEQERLKI